MYKINKKLYLNQFTKMLYLIYAAFFLIPLVFPSRCPFVTGILWKCKMNTLINYIIIHCRLKVV